MTNPLRRAAVVAALILVPSFASALELTCTMTDYGAAARHKGIKNLVPPKAVHQIDGASAKLKGMAGPGSVEQTGSKIKIKYFGTLSGVGEAEVTYSYSQGSGMMVARTRGLKTVQWDQEYPERTGKYLITGTCTER